MYLPSKFEAEKWTEKLQQVIDEKSHQHEEQDKTSVKATVGETSGKKNVQK